MSLIFMLASFMLIISDVVKNITWEGKGLYENYQYKKFDTRILRRLD